MRDRNYSNSVPISTAHFQLFLISGLVDSFVFQKSPNEHLFTTSYFQSLGLFTNLSAEELDSEVQTLSIQKILIHPFQCIQLDRGRIMNTC